MASNYHRHLAPCAGGRHEDAATRLRQLSNLPAHECAKPDQEIQEHADAEIIKPTKKAKTSSSSSSSVFRPKHLQKQVAVKEEIPSADLPTEQVATPVKEEVTSDEVESTLRTLKEFEMSDFHF